MSWDLPKQCICLLHLCIHKVEGAVSSEEPFPPGILHYVLIEKKCSAFFTKVNEFVQNFISL